MAGATCKPNKRAALAATLSARLHRWTYSPSGRVVGRTPFFARPLPELEQLQVAKSGTACCLKTMAATLRLDLADMGPRVLNSIFRWLRARPRRAARVQLQLENLHRGLPRGLPRRPLPPGARPVCDLRRPELGVQRALLGADRGRVRVALANLALTLTKSGTRCC